MGENYPQYSQERSGSCASPEGVAASPGAALPAVPVPTDSVPAKLYPGLLIAARELKATVVNIHKEVRRRCAAAQAA
ncbi:hypothetical protein HDC35_001500 [Sphingopyxis sp. JAI128]|nr:hypothetical protein [Sphingopyxis sp. JAI128]